MTAKLAIRRLATGVPGLDEILGGGLPEYSFNLIAGQTGSGKTTLAHQLMFSMASSDCRALFFTVLGETPLKMLRYQQQFDFFDMTKVGESVRFVNLADEVLRGDFSFVLKRIIEEVEKYDPALVFVDSFRSVSATGVDNPAAAMSLQQFVQQLGVRLTSLQATTFLVGEYSPADSETIPVFTVADGLIWLSQNVLRSSMVRKIQIGKMRGQPMVPGLHSFRIRSEGVRIFPRLIMPPKASASPAASVVPPLQRLSMGIAALDEMMAGGLPMGHSLLVSGPSGSGKTQLATAFLAEGVHSGEAGVIVAFDSSPSRSPNRQLEQMVAAGDVGVISTRALDLSIDETLFDLTQMVHKMNARRVVIDSLSGLELALAPEFREDFRESLYRMVNQLTMHGVSVLLTSELEDRYTDFRFSPYGSAFLTDAIIVQRYIEIEGQIRRVMAVVKIRASAHSHAIHEYHISDDGIGIGAALTEYSGLLSGHPRAH